MVQCPYRCHRNWHEYCNIGGHLASGARLCLCTFSDLICDLVKMRLILKKCTNLRSLLDCTALRIFRIELLEALNEIYGKLTVFARYENDK